MFRALCPSYHCSQPFYLFEFGAGSGQLALDILTYLRDRDPRVYDGIHEYLIGERSPALRTVQLELLLGGFGGKVRVVDVDASRSLAGVGGEYVHICACMDFYLP